MNSSSAATSGIKPRVGEVSSEIQWLVIEEMGRRDMLVFARHSLRFVLQFLGCKATKWNVGVRRLIEDLVTHVNETDCIDTWDLRAPELFIADVNQTIREQWSRRTLRSVSVDLLTTTSFDKTEFVVVLLVPKARFVDVLQNLLSTILRNEYQSQHIYRRISAVVKVVKRQQPLVIFCGGTSGCGKSTLANLVATRLGIQSVVSTDTIRELLRKNRKEVDCPELFASTYQAHEKVNETDPQYRELSDDERVLRAYEAQSRLVLEVLDKLINGFIRRSEPVVVEGVHLLSTYMLDKARSLAMYDVPVVPVLVRITNESKHKERFAIRSKSMTLLPNRNKYVKHFYNIRLIQDRLAAMVEYSEELLVVNNTNVDRSVNSIHAYLLACLENFQTFAQSGDSGTYLPRTSRRKSISGKEALRNIHRWRAEKRGQRARSAVTDNRAFSTEEAPETNRSFRRNRQLDIDRAAPSGDEAYHGGDSDREVCRANRTSAQVRRIDSVISGDECPSIIGS